MERSYRPLAAAVKFLALRRRDTAPEENARRGDFFLKASKMSDRWSPAACANPQA
jgi:hypothetical protein